MLARKVIVFGGNIESAVKLANCIEEVYFYNTNNRSFNRCKVESLGTMIYSINLVGLVESIAVTGDRYELIDDREEKMEVAESLGHKQITAEARKTIEEIRAVRYELKKVTVDLKVALSSHYLVVDETTEPGILTNSQCSALMDNRKAFQARLNELYQRFHSWFDPLLLRRTTHAL